MRPAHTTRVFEHRGLAAGKGEGCVYSAEGSSRCVVQYSSTNDVVVNLSGGKSTKRAALLTPSAAAAKDG